MRIPGNGARPALTHRHARLAHAADDLRILWPWTARADPCAREDSRAVGWPLRPRRCPHDVSSWSDGPSHHRRGAPARPQRVTHSALGHTFIARGLCYTRRALEWHIKA